MKHLMLAKISKRWNFSLHHFIALSLHHFIALSLHRFIASSLYYFIALLLHHFIASSLYHFIALSLHRFCCPALVVTRGHRHRGRPGAEATCGLESKEQKVYLGVGPQYHGLGSEVLLHAYGGCLRPSSPPSGMLCRPPVKWKTPTSSSWPGWLGASWTIWNCL